ncbi:hypothetical protein PoB_003789300 [Plakobranchus ocellatus]|uniref:Uncharacterized protein n=1 Tax=Plakobranchus ocellatus TaxID=259542 RepID=A0AAV4AX21_9GAST|nr:hypothetical protein PoB_003789300 [Plakobranchus ocellatus]
MLVDTIRRGAGGVPCQLASWNKSDQIARNEFIISTIDKVHNIHIRRWNKILVWKCRCHGHSEEELIGVMTGSFQPISMNGKKHPKVVQGTGMRPDIVFQRSWVKLDKIPDIAYRVHNVISGRLAGPPSGQGAGSKGSNSRQKGPWRSQGGLASHCATEAPFIAKQVETSL